MNAHAPKPWLAPQPFLCDDPETSKCKRCGSVFATGPLGDDLSAFDALIWDEDGVLICQSDCVPEYIEGQKPTHDRPYEGGSRIWGL